MKGFFSKLFGKKEENTKVRSREDQPDVYSIPSESERMNWAMEKSRWTLHYFEECLHNPKNGQSYFSIKVKIEDGDLVEHIWLSDPSFDDEGNLFGKIGNKPIDITNVALHQNIGIDRDLVSDWMILESGRLIGGYTIRAVREGLTREQDIKAFDATLGGIFIDEGEDHFLENNDTPEGAILMLEQALDDRDVERALDCKDFNVEARVLLSKRTNETLPQEIIDKTADVLKLSFLNFLQESGIPSFEGVKRAFPVREKLSDKHMIITEVCFYPDGGKSVQKLNVYNTDRGWKVLNPE